MATYWNSLQPPLAGHPSSLLRGSYSQKGKIKSLCVQSAMLSQRVMRGQWLMRGMRRLGSTHHHGEQFNEPNGHLFGRIVQLATIVCDRHG